MVQRTAHRLYTTRPQRRPPTRKNDSYSPAQNWHYPRRVIWFSGGPSPPPVSCLLLFFTASFRSLLEVFTPVLLLPSRWPLLSTAALLSQRTPPTRPCFQPSSRHLTGVLRVSPAYFLSKPPAPFSPFGANCFRAPPTFSAGPVTFSGPVRWVVDSPAPIASRPLRPATPHRQGVKSSLHVPPVSTHWFAFSRFTRRLLSSNHYMSRPPLCPHLPLTDCHHLLQSFDHHLPTLAPLRAPRPAIFTVAWALCLLTISATLP